MTQKKFEFVPDPPAQYPETAGFKERTTSREAALKVDAGTLRAEVLGWLKARGPHTPDEAARGLMKSVLAIRPRFTELRKLGLIVKATDAEGNFVRRLNDSGMRAQVWRIA